MRGNTSQHIKFLSNKLQQVTEANRVKDLIIEALRNELKDVGATKEYTRNLMRTITGKTKYEKCNEPSNL